MNPFWNYLLEASIGTALVWSGYYIFLRKLTFFEGNRFFLLAGMFITLLLPLLEIQLIPEKILPVQNLVISINGFEEIFGESGTFSSGSAGLIFEIFLYLYFSVVSIRLLIFGIGIISLIKKIRNSEVQIMNGIGIYIHPEFKPASFFNKILMPGFDKENNIHQQIFLHESEHVRLGHSWDLLFIHFMKSLLWINPFAYLIEVALREVHEFQADKKVIQKTALNTYCRLLVDNLTKHTHHPLYHSFNQFQIKNRIVMMNKRKSTNVEKWKYLIGMPLLVMMLGIMSWNMAEPVEKVTGTWVGSDFEFTLNEGPDLKEMVEGGKNLHLDGKLILNQNKTYQILDPSGTMNGEGKWSLGGMVLILDDHNGNATEYQIEEVTDNQMITTHQVSAETPMGKVSGTIRLTYMKE